MRNNKVRKVIISAIIASAYAVMTIIFTPISYGGIQFRISEMITILPYFFPVAVPGLFIGCIIANIISPYGLADMIIGSVATLAAALITMKIGKSKNKEKISVKVIACIPPVIINAIFIGTLIASWMVSEGEAELFWPAFMVYAVQIGFGQMAVMYLLGLPLMIYLPRMGVIDIIWKIYSHPESNVPDDYK